MIRIDDYLIWQEVNNNRIIIALPQTLDTLCTSAGCVSSRRQRLTDKEEAVILTMVREMFERGDQE